MSPDVLCLCVTSFRFSYELQSVLLPFIVLVLFLPLSHIIFEFGFPFFLIIFFSTVHAVSVILYFSMIGYFVFIVQPYDVLNRSLNRTRLDAKLNITPYCSKI